MISSAMKSAHSCNSRNLVVFGEFYLDLVFYNLPSLPRLGKEVKTRSFSRLPGGGLATTALVAAGLGTSTAVITRIGRDAQESSAWQALKQQEISTEYCEIDPNLPTAMTVCAAFGGDRMLITHDVINEKLENLLAHGLVQKEIRKAKHLHLACALRPPRAWAPAIHAFRSWGITVSADIGWNPEVLESPQLPTLLKKLEYLFPNEAEARAMTGKRSVEEAAKELARWVRVPVVKLGEDGSMAVYKGNILRMKSIRVRVVDATGAGDAFNGGFLHSSLAGWPLEACLRAGNVCGAEATTRAGGSSAVPTQRRLRELMKQIK
jgi:sugar/nucleoside kinase (ribokinase family)